MIYLHINQDGVVDAYTSAIPPDATDGWVLYAGQGPIPNPPTAYILDVGTWVFTPRPMPDAPQQVGNNTLRWEGLPLGSYVDVTAIPEEVFLGTAYVDEAGVIEITLPEAGSYRCQVFPESPFLPTTWEGSIT